MELSKPDAALAERAAPLVAELVHATGPCSYDHQFGPGWDLLDPFIDRAMGLVCVSETVAPGPCRDHGVPMEMRMVCDLRAVG